MIRTMTPRVPLLLVGLAFLVGACGTAAPTATVAGATGTAAPTLSATPTAIPSPSATPTDGPTPTASASAGWPVYHLDAARTGNETGFPAPGSSLSQAWIAHLDGAVYAEPLVVHGRLIAATENDSVYALDPKTGKLVWLRHLGTPVRLANLPCGDIDPLGITGTPAFDPTTGSLFAVAEVVGFHHILYALDPDTGAVRWSRVVDLTGDDPRTHQQRPALAVANGFVYIGFGGLAGDCGQYVGEEVGVPATGHGATIAYRVPVRREGAIWATGGPVIDQAGNLYVTTGNGSSTSSYDGSDSVLELSPSLKLLSRFAPSTWAHDNATDADLGSLSAVLVPGGFVFIAGKSSTGYVLRQGSLGGIGGQVSKAAVCVAFGGSAQDGTTVYVPCHVGIRQITVGTAGTLKVGWLSSSGGDPPVVGGGAIWSVGQNGTLYALSPSTGATLARVSLGAVPHFVSPTLWNGLVYVGTTGGVVAVKG
jgi:outer membrane protein assembly factor BamB